MAMVRWPCELACDINRGNATVILLIMVMIMLMMVMVMMMVMMMLVMGMVRMMRG